MKFKFNLENPYVPRAACGAEIVVPSIIGGLLGIGSTVSGVVTNSSNQGFSKEENEKNRQFSSKEAQKQRNYDERVWGDRFRETTAWQEEYTAYQNDLAMQSWREQQEYNSPANQAQRMLEAGFNPAAVGAQSTFGSGGLSPAPSSAPAVTSPGSSAASAPSPLSSGMQNPVQLGSLGSFIADVSKASKDNQILKPLLQGMLLGNETKALVNQGLEIDNYIKKNTKNAKIKESWETVKRITSEIRMNVALTGKYDSETNLNKEKELFVAAQTLLTETQQEGEVFKNGILSNQLSTWFETFSIWKKTQMSEQSRNYGQGAAAYSMVDLNEKLGKYYESVVALNKDSHAMNVWQRDVMGMDENGRPLGWFGHQNLEKSKDLFTSQINQQIDECAITHEQKLQAKELTKQMRVATDYAEFNQVLGALGNIVGMTNATRMATAANRAARASAQHGADYGRYVDSYGNFVEGQLNRINQQHIPVTGFGN